MFYLNFANQIQSAEYQLKLVLTHFSETRADKLKYLYLVEVFEQIVDTVLVRQVKYLSLQLVSLADNPVISINILSVAFTIF